MIIATVLLICIGLFLLSCGILIWKKEKLNLLHIYHRDKVSEDDKPAFCKISGIGIVFIGIGMLISAILVSITDSPLSFIAFGVGFITGFVMLIYAGLRYNN